MALGSWANTPLFPRASAEKFMKSYVREDVRKEDETDSALPKGPSTHTVEESDIMIVN